MFSYETGVGLAFITWIASIVMLLVSVNSQFNKNLYKIGQRMSWLTLTPKRLEPEYLEKSIGKKLLKFAILVCLGLPFVLTGWPYVVMAVGSFVYKRAKDSGAPQAIKEFRWKMRNVKMDIDQLVKELMKASDADPATFEKFKADLMADLEERGFRKDQIAAFYYS